MIFKVLAATAVAGYVYVNYANMTGHQWILLLGMVLVVYLAGYLSHALQEDDYED